MVLIKNQQVVEGDPWRHLADDAPIPETGDVIVSWRRAAAERDALDQSGRRVGIRVAPDDELDTIIPLLPNVSLVAIEFPKFSDGRGYTKARLLRERHGFRGEIRAVGEVLGDQLFYMARCGMDAFELVDGKDADAALRCFQDFTVTYQGATDEPRPLYRRVSREAAR